MENMNEKVFIGDELQKIHILTVAEDVVTIQRILSYASELCERSIINQSTLDLIGIVGQEANGTLFVDGQFLIRATTIHVYQFQPFSVLLQRLQLE